MKTKLNVLQDRANRLREDKKYSLFLLKIIKSKKNKAFVYSLFPLPDLLQRVQFYAVRSWNCGSDCDVQHFARPSLYSSKNGNNKFCFCRLTDIRGFELPGHSCTCCKYFAINIRGYIWGLLKGTFSLRRTRLNNFELTMLALKNYILNKESKFVAHNILVIYYDIVMVNISDVLYRLIFINIYL